MTDLAARDRFLAPLVLERDVILAARGTDVSATREHRQAALAL